MREYYRTATCLFAAVAGGLIVFMAQDGLADDAPSPIRQFDIATVEKLGQDMYAQDQEAWKASDVLTAQYSADQRKAEKLHGWIVDARGNFAVVRFVRDGANGPEIFCNVTFAQDFAPNCTEPQDRTLDPEELAQYDARTLALKNVDHPCSDTYNTVALRDPQGDGWLVWAMAATKTDSDLIIIGGHYRFTISADGKTIREKDALSKSCLQFHRDKGPNGEKADIIFTHVVSPVPIETEVFASLSYKVPFRIGTLDGKAWKIEGAAIANIDMDMPGTDGASARYLAAFNENCQLMVNKVGDADKKNTFVTIKSVIDATEGDAKFSPEVPEGDVAVAVICGRTDLVPAPNDYKVVLGGLPLFIDDRGLGHSERMGTLEISGGQFRFRTMKGDMMTAEQQARIGARLDEFQNIVQSGH